MRRLIPALLLLCACAQDRPRPEPFDAERADLFVEVRKPVNNATIFGARPLDIEIFATDLSGRGRLNGHGYVVRRGGVKVDSIVRRFNPRTDSLRTFTYTVPDLPTNTQLDIHGLAFGAGGELLEGPPTMLVVVKCSPTFPGCQ